MQRFIVIAVIYALFHFALSFSAMWIAMDLEANWTSPWKPYEDLFLGITMITSLPGVLLLPLLQWLPRGPGVASPWLYVVFALNACLWGGAVSALVRAVWRPAGAAYPGVAADRQCVRVYSALQVPGQPSVRPAAEHFFVRPLEAPLVNGVLVRLLSDTRGRPGYWFGVVFKPVIPKLDTLCWHPLAQPWMGPPSHFDEPELTWRRGGLRRYGECLAEELIEMWGLEAMVDSPKEEDASAILIYTDSTCWELYSSDARIVQAVFDHVRVRPEMKAVRATLCRRGEAFGAAGLSEVWRALQGRA